MNTNQLVEAANEAAVKRSAAYQEIVENADNRNDGIDKWWKCFDQYPEFVEFNGVICQSTVCFKGSTQYFQNRFYVRKASGSRGTFSRAKAIAKLG